MTRAGRGGGDPDGLVGVTKAMAFLDCGKTTLYRMMDTGQIPYTMFGGKRKIAWSTLREIRERALKGVREAG